MTFFWHKPLRISQIPYRPTDRSAIRELSNGQVLQTPAFVVCERCEMGWRDRIGQTVLPGVTLSLHTSAKWNMIWVHQWGEITGKSLRSRGREMTGCCVPPFTAVREITVTDGIQLFNEYIGVYLFKFGAIEVTRKLSSAMPVRATYVRRILLASTALYHVRGLLDLGVCNLHILW